MVISKNSLSIIHFLLFHLVDKIFYWINLQNVFLFIKPNLVFSTKFFIFKQLFHYSIFMSHNKIQIRIARVNPQVTDIPLPSYATTGSAGIDIYAAVEDKLVISPNQTRLIPTGFQIELPQGYEAQIRPRSGLAINHNIGILNSPGTIDSDYRGEVKVILRNFGNTDFVVRRGDRIAQMVVAPYVRVTWEEVKRIEETERGNGGFGHTGK